MNVREAYVALLLLRLVRFAGTGLLCACVLALMSTLAATFPPPSAEAFGRGMIAGMGFWSLLFAMPMTFIGMLAVTWRDFLGPPAARIDWRVFAEEITKDPFSDWLRRRL